jgi:hypothetical protein
MPGWAQFAITAGTSHLPLGAAGSTTKLRRKYDVSKLPICSAPFGWVLTPLLASVTDHPTPASQVDLAANLTGDPTARLQSVGAGRMATSPIACR